MFGDLDEVLIAAMGVIETDSDKRDRMFSVVPDGDDPKSPNYSGKKVLEPAIPVNSRDKTKNGKCYNCHSYVWNKSQGDPSDPAGKEIINVFGLTNWDTFLAV